ncbi:PASTA domain-containing protein [Hoylesella buccalis]|uniref:PASTA domain-containing protein n=1 Tax=Hoylesella buccalis TaxID=28127 RepID=UPI003996125D
MKSSEFFNKFKSFYLWGNLLGMAVAIVLVCLGVRYGLDIYTHHGESIAIPDVKRKSFKEAEKILSQLGFKSVVSDTGYVKTIPPDCVLEQTPAAGDKVKTGRIIYLTINASKSPTITLPDVIDNSSLREAMAKLTAMGFKVGTPQFIPGEKDWVYGILVRGKHVVTGDRISIEDTVIIQAGNGMRDSTDVIDYVDPIYPEYDPSEGDDVDGFEEVTGPVTETEEATTHPQEVKPINPSKTEPTVPQKKEPMAPRKTEPTTPKSPKSTPK